MVLQSQPASSAKKHWMVALAERIPKVKTTGDVMADQQELLIRKSLESILQRFADDPQSCINVATSLQAGMIQSVSPKKDQADADLQPWDSSFKYFRKMPKYYMSQVLVELASDNKKLNKDLVNLIDKKNKDAVRNLFFMVMGLGPANAWPTDAHDRGVCHAMLQSRSSQVGHRMQAFLSSKALNYTTGEIDWMKCAAYSVVWGGTGSATHVKHISGASAEIKDFVINDSWELSEPWLDATARFVKGKLVVWLHELFGDDDGPNKIIIDEKAADKKHMHTIAADLTAELVAADIARAKLQANTLKVDSDFLSISTKEKRDEGLKRARDKAAAHKIESKRAKVLVLSPGAIDQAKQ